MLKSKNSIQIDFLGDGLRIFLDYIDRQLNKNPDYTPHPLIRALELALLKTKEIEAGQCVMGVSQDGTDKNICNPFAVIIQKHEGDNFEVKEIRNLKVDKVLPLDIMIIIFRLQISLDKIKGDSVDVYQCAECLNAVIPGNYFFALGNKWKEARGNFKELLEKGKVGIPRSTEMEKIADELKSITYDTPWEDYSSQLRSLIGGSIKESVREAGDVIITTPESYRIEKYKVFDMAIEFMIGKVSENVNLFKKPVNKLPGENNNI